LFARTKVTNEHLLPVGNGLMPWHLVWNQKRSRGRGTLIVVGSEGMGAAIVYLGSARISITVSHAKCKVRQAALPIAFVKDRVSHNRTYTIEVKIGRKELRRAPEARFGKALFKIR